MAFIVDTTLRDGEQRAGIAFSFDEKVEIARLLDSACVFQIEAGIPAMDELELKAVTKISRLCQNAMVSAWSRMVKEDIIKAMHCEVDLIHISVPSSEIQISKKLNKSKEWIKEEMLTLINWVINQGFSVSIGFEDASRAEISFLLDLTHEAYCCGVSRIRYADTVGILYPSRIINELSVFKETFNNLELEIHTHNDFGMAVANSLAAESIGFLFVDCTLDGIGERSGNCNLIHFLKAYNKINGKIDNTYLFKEAEDLLLKITNSRSTKKHFHHP